jgi:hypothetical protein
LFSWGQAEPHRSWIENHPFHLAKAEAGHSQRQRPAGH